MIRAGNVIALRELITEGYSHAENLHLFISEVLDEAGLHPENLQAVAASKGPGSYTGLRIGVSAAKGLCVALNIPLIAYPVTLVLAHVMRAEFPDAPLYVPMIDARRMEVYTAAYDDLLNERKPVTAKVVDAEFFASFPEGTVFAGDGVAKCASLVLNGQVWRPLHPSAAMAAAIVAEKLHEGIFEDVARFEPFYLKDFIAGRKA